MLYVKVASSPEPPSIVIPAPFITADVLLPLSNTMLWSFKVTVVEFTVVVVPETIKFPGIVTVEAEPLPIVALTVLSDGEPSILKPGLKPEVEPSLVATLKTSVPASSPSTCPFMTTSEKISA